MGFACSDQVDLQKASMSPISTGTSGLPQTHGSARLLAAIWSAFALPGLLLAAAIFTCSNAQKVRQRQSITDTDVHIGLYSHPFECVAHHVD